MNELIPLAISVIATIIGTLSVFYAIKTREKVEEAQEFMLNTLDKTLEEALTPVKQTISKSYSQLGTMGATAKQVKALDKRIAQDVIDMQNPMIQAALDMFPNVKEYVEKNPHLLTELLPRIQALQGIEGFNVSDLLGSPSPSLPSPSHPHPFGRNEE